MKRFKPGIAVIWLLGACLLIPQRSQARLPRPLQASGTILAVDVDSKTLLFKQGNGKKPFLLNWNKETEFRNGEKTITPEQIISPAAATIFYKDLTFRHPLLKKVLVSASRESVSRFRPAAGVS
jgi:hypothetical protein